jgi:hypothetical protein
MEQMNKEMREEIAADAKFAKDHPEEWKAKKAKEKQEHQAFMKPFNDRQAAIDEQHRKEEQYKKDTEAYQAAEYKKHLNQLKADQEAEQKRIEQIGINAQNQAHQDAVDAANFAQPADSAADRAAVLAQVEEINDRKWQALKNAKPADTESTP